MEELKERHLREWAQVGREEWEMGRGRSWSRGRKGKVGRVKVRREAWMGL